jgi:preprotein translocase subunit YajC
MEIIFSLVIILLIIVGYWSLAVFPKQREYKKHIKYLNTIEVGDDVITFGGLIGTVTHFDDEIGVARLRLAEGFEIRILTAAINRRYDPEELKENLRLAQGLPTEVSGSGAD